MGPWGDVCSAGDREILAELGANPDRQEVLRALQVASQYGDHGLTAARIVAALKGLTMSEFKRAHPWVAVNP
jgi:hypothetical protein